MEYSEMKFIPSAMNFIPVGRVRFHNDTTTILTKPRIHKASSIPVKYISRCKIDTNILKNCKKNQCQISYIRYLKSDIFSGFFYSCCSIIFFLQSSNITYPSTLIWKWDAKNKKSSSNTRPQLWRRQLCFIQSSTFNL